MIILRLLSMGHSQHVSLPLISVITGFLALSFPVPIAAPQGLYCDAHNSTAMLVTWELVADTRETMKGKVWGYQVRRNRFLPVFTTYKIVGYYVFPFCNSLINDVTKISLREYFFLNALMGIRGYVGAITFLRKY